jgi:anthranilate/para-aminobenzoate synthase component I
MIFSKFKWINDSILELTRPKSAYIYYRKTRLNLLTGFPEVYHLDLFLKHLGEIQIQDKVSNPTVFHFYYEFGLVMMGLGHAVDDNSPIAVEIEYENKAIKKRPTSKLKGIPLKSLERPSWSEYKGAFNHIQEHLLNGNCYQVNLTYPFDFETEEQIDPRDICNYFFSQKNLSAYAHATFLGDEMILSNSPECLFQYQKNKMFTMPIKGTVQLGHGSFQSAWNKMKKDFKEEGELNMITDLLRNDLNRLEKPRAKVLKKRAPLFVPGLLHQCSVLSVELENNLSFLKTMESLFPGGSITGAPKKRVMEIIQEVERYSRGIYCGSTVLCLADKKVASINIRTFSISVGDRLWRYGAGGGITLLSKATSEYQEMEAKVSSFLTLLRAPGYISQKK